MTENVTDYVAKPPRERYEVALSIAVKALRNVARTLSYTERCRLVNVALADIETLVGGGDGV